MEVSVQLVLYFEQGFFFLPGPDNTSNVVTLCSFLYERDTDFTMALVLTANISIRCQKEHDGALSSIMHCSV